MIIITRPSPYGEELTKLCLSAGIKARHIPFFKITAGHELCDIGPVLKLLSPSDIVIITSPQVSLALQNRMPLLSLPNHLNYFAVGLQSAKLFNQLTKCHVSYPNQAEDENSEGLIKLISQQIPDLKNRQVVILKGNQGRKLLEDFFTDKGCKVRNIECYQRIKESIEPNTFDDETIRFIVITTIEHLIVLESLLSESRKNKVTLIVPNKRTYEKAALHNWPNIILSESANNQILFKTINSLCHNAD